MRELKINTCNTMRRIVLFIGAMAIALAMASCDDKKKAESQTETPWKENTVQSVRDSTVFGICADGSAMNTLQMVTDSGDTLTLSTTDVKEAGMQFGGYGVGDRMAVVMDVETKSVRMIVNESTLMGNWVMLNPLDGTSYIGFCIKDGGIAEGINQSQLIYKTWSLRNGMLEMRSVREGGGDFEEREVFQILFLSSDSLCIKDIDREAGSTIYEYIRPVKEDTYEDLDLDLEDDSFDDFAM